MRVQRNIALSCLKICIQAGIHEKEVEQFTSSLQLLVRDIDMVLNAHGIGHYKAATAIAAIRDGISQLATNPRDPIQLHNLIQRLAEQMLYAYRSGDSIPLAQQHSNIRWYFDMFSAAIRSLMYFGRF